MNHDRNTDSGLSEIFSQLAKKLPAILLTTAFFVVIAFSFAYFFITPLYESSCGIYIISKGSSISSITLSDLQIGSQLTNDYMVIYKSKPVLNQVISDLGLEMTYAQLRDSLTIKNPSDTRILNLTVTNSDPNMAKKIVDHIVLVGGSEIARVMDTVQPSIYEPGDVAQSPSWPSLIKITVIAGIIGFLISAGIASAKMFLNDRIVSEDDITGHLGIPVLAVIPMDNSLKPTIKDKDRSSLFGFRRKQ